MKTGVIALVLASIASLAALAVSHGALGAETPDGKSIFSLNCAACHGANGEGGGLYPPLASNPDVNQADSANLIRIVLDGRTGPITVSGTQYGSDMPAWRAVFSDAQIAAVLTYVRSAWGNSAPAVSEEQIATARSPKALTGAGIFALKCSACHLASGGGTDDFPALKGDALVTGSDLSSLLGVIVNGRNGSVTVNGKTYSGVMPAWPGRLTDADVAALATYVRTSWGNKASAVSERDVGSAGAAITLRVGGSVFANNCAACHGSEGQGGVGPALAGNARVNAADASSMIETIMQGRNFMPSWRGQLSAGEIAAVATYVRSSWGNNASTVTVEEVTSIK